MAPGTARGAADLKDLQQSLAAPFKDEGLLRRALVHSSYLHEHLEEVGESNERLEFLGDAVLGFLVTQDLYRRSPGLPEGEMTVLRSALVSGQCLAQVARSLGLGSYLVMGAGEERSGGRERERNLAGALEAVVGALFLDQGYLRCRQVVRRLLGQELRRLAREGVSPDPKSQLQQALQARRAPLPRYRTVEAVGPEHARRFTVEVESGGRVLGTGAGARKALAEQEAAREALHRLRQEAAGD